MLVLMIGAMLLIIGSFTAGVIAMFLRSKARERLQKERMLLVEKGMEVPKELYALETKPFGEPRSVRMGLLLVGVFLLVVGIFPVVINLDHGFMRALQRGFFMFAGVALLICERVLAWAGVPLLPK